MKISVLVPVYKEPKYLADIARKILANDYEDKELIVVVDELINPEINEVLTSLKTLITVIYPGEHLGKAEALNRAVKQIETDVILFLDNDILLPENPLFLSQLALKIKNSDIVEMPKEVIVESVFSAMIGYEYQSMALSGYLFSKFAKRSPGVIGAAFAVKKELFDRMGGFKKVVHEDGDFGARAFRLHAKYTYVMPLKVKTTMPNTFKDWVIQRKRWTLINVLWFKDNILYLLKSVFRQPSLIPTLALIVLPSLLSLIIFFILQKFNLSFITPVIFVMAQPFQYLAGILLWLGQNSLFSQGLISTAVGFLCTALLYGIFSWVNKFKFNPLTFALFYFLYLPVLMLINIIMFIVQIRETSIDLDWKV